MREITVVLLSLYLTFSCGCVSTAVGVATDVAIGIAKVPIKVASAAIDLATPDRED